VRLQDTGQDDADPVQHDLRHEHASIRVPTSTARAHAGASPSSPRTSRGAASAPATATGTRTTTVQLSSALAVREAATPVAGRDRPGEHRDDEGGERPARDELEDDVGHGVGDGVDVADAGRAERARQHRDPHRPDGREATVTSAIPPAAPSSSLGAVLTAAGRPGPPSAAAARRR
jgi:hypothetical protein